MVLTDHLFDKVRSIDMTLGQVRGAARSPRGHLAAHVEEGVTELALIIEWTRPLHVVVIAHDIRAEERILRVYAPDKQHRSADFRVWEALAATHDAVKLNTGGVWQSAVAEPSGAESVQVNWPIGTAARCPGHGATTRL